MAKREQPDQGWRQWVLGSIQNEANATQTAGFEPGSVSPEPFSVPMALAPNYDVAELLPPAAADRLRALRQRFHDTNAIIPKHAEIQEATTSRIQAEQRLARLRAHQQDGGFNLLETDSRVIEQQRLVEKLTGQAKRLMELQEVRSAAWQSASHVLTAVEGWLKDGRPPGVVLADHEGPTPTLNKGENVLDAIERLRRRGRELRADLHRIKSAPFPSNYAKQQMRAQIEALAMQGSPIVSDLIEHHDRQITWPTMRATSQVFNAQPGAIAFAEVPDAVALLAWLHKDALIKRLDTEIGAEADDAVALTHEQRQQREAEAQGDLLAIERDESWLVWSAMAQNLPIEHRADCAPQAILQVRLVTVPRATNGQGTSPMHAWDIAYGTRQ